MRKKKVPTIKKLITLPTWQYDWLSTHTSDDASKEIRRAIKAWIQTHDILSASANQNIISNNK